jgi:hypothetical protein
LSDENYQAGVYGINTFKLALVVAASLYAQQYQVEVASYATNLIEEKIGEITKAVEEQARSMPTTLLNAPLFYGTCQTALPVQTIKPCAYTVPHSTLLFRCACVCISRHKSCMLPHFFTT